MLQHSSPIESANFLADYINANVSVFPEHLKVHALEAVREVSPVARMARGIEVVFAVVLDPASPDRETGLNALGSASMQVTEGNFWGKQDRAISFVKWVRAQLGEWPDGIDLPEIPEVDASLAPPATEWPAETPAGTETPPPADETP